MYEENLDHTIYKRALVAFLLDDPVGAVEYTNERGFRLGAARANNDRALPLRC